MYDQIQALLTSTINIVTITGLAGIVVHALYNWHLSQLPTAPKANPGYQRSELVTEVLETLRAEGEQISECIESLEDDGLQIEVETETTPEPQIDLNSLDAVTLRKLCTQHQIGWRNFRGANRHMPKATMIFNLQQCLTA